MTSRLRLGFFLALALTPGCARPKPALSQIRFGVRAAEHDLWREAVLHFERAHEIAPGDAAALNNLGVAYERLGRIEEAFEAYRQARMLDPSDRRIDDNLTACVGRWRTRIARPAAPAPPVSAGSP